jgi:hypothetical protein
MIALRFLLTRPVLFFLLSGTAVDSALAVQHSVLDTLTECTSVSDDGQRLTCFDQEMTRLITAPASENAPVVQSSTTVDSTSEAEVVDEFGMTAELASKDPEKEADESLKELTAVVVALRKRPHGEQVVTLENGQVWTQSHAEAGLLIREGDTVTIQRGLFGSYRITGRGKKSFAVERIE